MKENKIKLKFKFSLKSVKSEFILNGSCILFSGTFVSDSQRPSGPCSSAACSNSARVSGGEFKRKKTRSWAENQGQVIGWAGGTKPQGNFLSIPVYALYSNLLLEQV